MWKQVSTLPKLQFRSFLDLVSINRPAGNFEDIHRIITVRAILRAGIIALRANRDIPFDMRHSFLAVNPDEIERDLGVLHPECPGLGLAEKKEHSVILLEVIPVHEPNGTLQWGVGNFGLDDGTRGSLNRDELRVGCSAGRYLAPKQSSDHYGIESK